MSSGNSIMLTCVSLAFSCLTFGGAVPIIRRVRIHDGFFALFIVGNVVWMAGLLVNLIQEWPTFEQYAVFGGCFFAVAHLAQMQLIHAVGSLATAIGQAIGSSICLFCVTLIGLKLTSDDDSSPLTTTDIWSVSTLLFCATCFGAWATVFDTKLQHTELVQQQLSSVNCSDVDESYTRHSSLSNPELNPLLRVRTSSRSSAPAPRSPTRSCLLFLATVLIGTLHSASYIPIQHLSAIASGRPGRSANTVDYFFSFASGVGGVSTALFMFYAMVRQNRPRLLPKGVLPVFLVGLLIVCGSLSLISGLTRTLTVLMIPYCLHASVLPTFVYVCFRYGSRRPIPRVVYLLVFIASAMSLVVLENKYKDFL